MSVSYSEYRVSVPVGEFADDKRARAKLKKFVKDHRKYKVDSDDGHTFYFKPLKDWDGTKKLYEALLESNINEVSVDGFRTESDDLTEEAAGE